MIYRITVKDEAVYELSDFDCSEKEAIAQCWDWFNARKPNFKVEKIKEEPNEYYYWAVVNPDGTFAGVPCQSEEEARELACQQEGRRIFQMAYDPNIQIIWD